MQSAEVPRPTRWIPVLAVIAASAGLASASAQSIQLSDNVRRGGIDSRQRDQSGSRIRRSRATGIVYAPADEVTDVVVDYGAYQRFMPHTVASRVLSKRGSQARVYLEVSALEGLARLWVEMQIGMSAPSPETRVVAARMLRGNVRGFEAEWHVTALGAGRTLVTFELCADPDFAVPFADGLVSDYNEKEARDSVLALRRYLSRQRPSAR